jgi:quercetin dioxygenase-like cupin family protein
VLKGRLRVQYAAGEETVREGDFIYLPAGHTGVAEEDTDFLEVTATHLHQEFVANAQRNLQAMQAGAASAG